MPISPGQQRERVSSLSVRPSSYGVVGVSLVLGYLATRGVSSNSSAELHTVVETITTTLALVAGCMALVRFRSRNDTTFLILGTAFLGVGFLDGYHALVTSKFLEESLPSDLQSLIPWSWLASRVFLAGALTVSVVVSHREDRLTRPIRVDERIVYVTAGVLTLASFAFFAFVPLPDPHNQEFLFHRPAELIAAALFSLALIGYLTKGACRRDPFEHWLVLALIVNVAIQMLFMSQSQRLFDLDFDVAHALKGTSYVFVLVGLFINMSDSFRAVDRQIVERLSVEEELRETQQRLQFALEASSDGLWDWNINTGEVFFSRRWAESLGYTPEDVVPHFDFWRTVIHPDDMGPTLKAVEAYFEGKTDLYENENRLLMKSGEYRHNLDRGRIVAWNTDGTPARMVGTDIDVTARKASEMALRTSELRHRSVVESMVDGLVTIDGKGNIESFNPAAERIFGYDRDEVIGKNVNVLMPEPTSGEHDSHLARYLDGGDPHVIGAGRDVVGRRKDGSVFPMALSVTEMRVGEDRLFTGLVRDISEAKEAEEKLQRYVAVVEEARSKIEKQAESLTKHAEELSAAKDRAEEATVAKSQFLASMSHEIRTPMNGVLGMTQLLLDTDLTAEQLEHVTTIRSSADALLTIINDILDFSKIEAGKLEIEPIPFDLQTAVAEVMDLIAGKAEEKGLELIIRYLPDHPKEFVGDPGRIRQILLNLVSNAVKFTDTGHVVVDVDISSTDASDTADVRVKVCDTGVGVEPAAQARLFQPFSQADPSTTRLFGGTGLGLAICRRLIELMNGDIGMESQPGHGSAFWFRVPLPRVAESESHSMAVAKVRGRVLVVDDLEITRRVFREQLEACGLSVDCADSGQAAFRLLRGAVESHHPYDVVVTEDRLSGLDGEALAVATTSDPSLGAPLLILSTATPNRGDAKRFQDLGFAGYISKPVPPGALRDIVTTVLTGQTEQLVTRHSVRETRRDASGSGFEQRGPVPVELENLRVLLAEDNIVNQKVASRMLQKLGCRVDVAANGAEAVRMWRDLPYDVVFMDCQMPELDGFEATQRIRGLEGPERRTPIVALTANAMRGDREICMAAGMDDYMSKPIDASKLRSLLVHWAPAKIAE